MKITIKNEGVAGHDALTIFTRAPDYTEHHVCLEGGQEITIDWYPETEIRYELVPWLRT